MSTLSLGDKVYNREVSFCKVYSLESKKKLEKMFLNNRISYYIEWQDKTLIQRIFAGKSSKEKNVFTVRINEADIERAKELLEGIDSIKMRKKEKENQ